MSRCVPSESYSSQRVCFLPSISPLFLNSQTLDFSESELLFTRPRRAETGFACALFLSVSPSRLSGECALCDITVGQLAVYFSTARIAGVVLTGTKITGLNKQK